MRHYTLIIDELKYMSGVAPSAHITHLSLSRFMRRLKEELGCELFDRTRNRATPNEAGRVAMPTWWRIALAMSVRTWVEVDLVPAWAVSKPLTEQMRLPSRRQRVFRKLTESFWTGLSFRAYWLLSTIERPSHSDRSFGRGDTGKREGLWTRIQI